MSNERTYGITEEKLKISLSMNNEICAQCYRCFEREEEGIRYRPSNCIHFRKK